MRKAILILPLMIAFTAVLAFALVQRDSGEAAGDGVPSGGPITTVNYACYFAPGLPVGAGVVVENQFMPAGEVVTVGIGDYVCPPTDKSGTGIPPVPTLRCYGATSPFPGGDLTAEFEDQYGVFEHTIGELVELCVPASKVPGIPPEPEPYYACYDSPAPIFPSDPVIIENQFGPSVFFPLDRVWVCVASLKGGAGSTDVYPPLTCYFGAGDLVLAPVPIETQFGSESVLVEEPALFCTEAIKSVPVTPTDTPTATPTVTPTPTPAPPVNYTCYFALGEFPPGVDVGVVNQFMPDGEFVTAEIGELVCVPTDKSGTGDIPLLPTLRCFMSFSPFQGGDLTVEVADQFGAAEHTIGDLVEFCVPARKAGGQPDPEPYYACYDSPAAVNAGQVIIANQFGISEIGTAGRAWVCVPSLKNGTGSTESYPPLTCYTAGGPPADVQELIESQFGPEILLIEVPVLFCTEAIKLGPPPKLTKPGDTDGDGCPDAHENRTKAQASQGGGRDYLDPNDYYDVLGPFGSLVLDGVIDLPNDILGVILHFSPQGQPPYDVRFDRGLSIPGQNHWKRAAPDGVIDLPNDILGVILQHAHNCV